MHTRLLTYGQQLELCCCIEFTKKLMLTSSDLQQSRYIVSLLRTTTYKLRHRMTSE